MSFNIITHSLLTDLIESSPSVHFSKRKLILAYIVNEIEVVPFTVNLYVTRFLLKRRRNCSTLTLMILASHLRIPEFCTHSKFLAPFSYFTDQLGMKRISMENETAGTQLTFPHFLKRKKQEGKLYNWIKVEIVNSR